MSGAKLNKKKRMSSPVPQPDTPMTITLEPDKLARLVELAQARGISTDDLVRQVIEELLAEASEVTGPKEPTHSLRGLLAKYGPAPSAEDIDQNRAEMFANFPRSDF